MQEASFWEVEAGIHHMILLKLMIVEHLFIWKDQTIAKKK
jgi:hypothetical protein